MSTPIDMLAQWDPVNRLNAELIERYQAQLTRPLFTGDDSLREHPSGTVGGMDEFAFGRWSAIVDRKLDRILHALSTLTTLEVIEMADLTALTADVSANTDATASAVTLLNSIAQQLRDAATDPAAIQALATSIETNTQSLADAVTANTPAAPAPA